MSDDVEARYALRAPEPLATFNRAGYVRAADVHVATRLGALAGEASSDVLLAFALLVRVVRDGSTCLVLAEAHDLAPEILDEDDAAEAPVTAVPWPEPQAWEAAVEASPLVEAGVLRWEEGRLYLDRYWGEERAVAADLMRRRDVPVPAVGEAALAASLDCIFPAGYEQQRDASAQLVRSMTSVLTGGPGSGKTTTVAGFLAVLADQSTVPLRIALTAPTGKAAARLQEAVDAASRTFPPEARARLAGLEASTLHRLLGWRPGSRTRFRHDRTNTLPHDVVVVDESSMLSLTLTARLLEALRPTTRLVLVGDADQLASVDAGAVLSDLVGGVASSVDAGVDAPSGRASSSGTASPSGLDADADAAAPVATAAEVAVDSATADDAAGVATPPTASGRHDEVPAHPMATIVRLTGSHRYSGAIGELARAVRAGDADAVMDVLRRGEGMRLVEDADPGPVLRPELLAHAVEVRAAARAGEAEEALRLLGRHRVLCAHRAGPAGVRTWNRRIEGWVTEETGDALYEPMYVGRPLIVTSNDYGLGLYNGDTGVVVAGRDGGPAQAVMAGAGGTVQVSAGRLADVETMHAMTVHKAQGSEADDITILMPPDASALLTRELLYTAVTRARRSVTLVGSQDAVVAALGRRARRASGLAARLRE